MTFTLRPFTRPLDTTPLAMDLSDVTLGEDRSPVRMGQAPQVLASLNNRVIGLAARHKQGNLAAWQRQLAYRFDKAWQRGQGVSACAA